MCLNGVTLVQVVLCRELQHWGEKKGYEMNISLEVCFLNNCDRSLNTRQANCPQRAQWKLLIIRDSLSLCFLPETSNFWSNLNYQLSSYESTEVVTPSAHYNMAYWNQKTLPLMLENACFLCLNAISYSQRLFPLITVTLNTICLIKLKENSALCEVQWSQALSPRCLRLLWQSHHYKTWH